MGAKKKCFWVKTSKKTWAEAGWLGLLAVVHDQGWAGIPVPVHSLEWTPLIPNYGNGFFHSLYLPVFCKFFPFPKFGTVYFSFLSCSRICHFTDGNWNIVRDNRLPIISASSSFLFNQYWRGKLRQGVREWLKRQGILLSFIANSYTAKVSIIVKTSILLFIVALKRQEEGGLSKEEKDMVENI